MPQDTKPLSGALYASADQFSDQLEAGTQAAADQMTAAWGQAYGRTRIEMDQLLAKIDAAKAAGEPMSPAWLYQRQRLKGVLDTSKVEIARYAKHASATTIKAQQSAVLAAQAHAAKLAKTAMAEAGPGLAQTFAQVNPNNLKHLAGFMADGSPLSDLFDTLPAQASANVKAALVQGVALGKGTGWMRRKATEGLGIARTRAETIMRTESLRAYRYTSRETYLANSHVLGGWVWHAHLDARCCAACVLLDGTEYPLDSILDGHPRCRCAMVPRTKSWEELGLKGVEDTRPPTRSGRDWFLNQSAAVQRGILGRRKYQAWLNGDIKLDDVIARSDNPKWGTMRRERSLREIKEGRNGNWDDVVAPPKAPTPPVALKPEPKMVQAIAGAYDLDQLEGFVKTSGTFSEQQMVNMQAAIQTKLNTLDYGPALPAVDAVKIQAAVNKLNQAALTKGYPSKGYSQTKAVYKAHASGKVGAPVGPLKALTLEQKLTAQAILDKHNSDLPMVLRGAEKDKAVQAASKAGEDKALDTINAYSSHYTTEVALDQAVEAAKKDVLFAPTDYQLAKAQAHLKAMEAVQESYYDARASLLAKEVKTYEAPPGSTGYLTIQDDGWAIIDYETSSQTLNPIQANRLLSDPDNPWTPVIEPEPAAVQSLTKILADKDGNLDPDMVSAFENDLAQGIYSPKDAVNVQAALAQAKATLLPKPEPAYVANILKKMETGDWDGAYINKILLDPNTTPLQKANVGAALDQYQAKMMAKADYLDADAGQVLAEATPAPGPYLPDVTKMTAKPGTLGTHGAKVYVEPDGTRWLFKAQDDFLSEVDQATAKMQARAGLSAPDTFIVTIGGKRGSIQRMFDATDAFPGTAKPATWSKATAQAVQREHVLDWFISNHDAHNQQWLKLPDGNVVSIDKGQAFRWFGQDSLDWDFHPNAAYGAPEPVYNAMWREFAKGGKNEIDLETIRDQAKRIQAIPDAEIRAMFRPYAEAAARERRLMIPQPNFPGIKATSYPSNDVDAFLDALVARKANLLKDFDDLYAKAAAQRKVNLPGWVEPGAKPRKTSAKVTTWKGKDQPKAPDAPQAPEVAASKVFDGWLAKAEARYQANPNKAKANLQATANWSRFQRVIDDQDRTALKELLDRQYLDQDLYQEGLDLINDAARLKASAKADYERALKAHEKAMVAWRKDVLDWRDANGIKGPAVTGMDAGVKRHGTNPAGERWAKDHFSARKYTSDERQNLNSYTGSSFRSWNQHLRDTQGKPSQYQGAYSSLDSAMRKQPIPEDVIIHRGVSASSGDRPFTLGGQRLNHYDDLTQLVGSVQVDHAYMSTSVGRDAAFSSSPILLVIRAPAGTPGAYVQTFSQFSSEREIILGRGQRMYVHAAYRSGSQWVLEMEIVPEGFDPTGVVPSPSAKPWRK